MILTVLPDSFYDLKWPIYSCFLIGKCTFFTISPVTSGIFNFLKHFNNFKSPPYAPVFNTGLIGLSRVFCYVIWCPLVEKFGGVSILLHIKVMVLLLIYKLFMR